MIGEKEVKLSPQRFANAKSLIRYVDEHLNPNRHHEDWSATELREDADDARVTGSACRAAVTQS